MGTPELQKLHGQIQVAFHVRGVHDVDDAARVPFQQKLPRDHLLAGVWRHGVDARQVRDLRFRMAADAPVLAVHRDAGEIAHVLARSSELVEQRGLAAVLVAHERERHGLALGQRMLVGLVVEPAALAEAGVRQRLLLVEEAPHARSAAAVGDGTLVLHLDPPRVVEAQRQLVAMDAHLHGVAHGRVLHHGDVDLRDDAHVQEVLAQRSLAADRDHRGRVPEGKVVQRAHVLVSSRRRRSPLADTVSHRLLSRTMVALLGADGTKKFSLANGLRKCRTGRTRIPAAGDRQMRARADACPGAPRPIRRTRRQPPGRPKPGPRPRAAPPPPRTRGTAPD